MGKGLLPQGGGLTFFGRRTLVERSRAAVPPRAGKPPVMVYIYRTQIYLFLSFIFRQQPFLLCIFWLIDIQHPLII